VLRIREQLSEDGKEKIREQGRGNYTWWPERRGWKAVASPE